MKRNYAGYKIVLYLFFVMVSAFLVFYFHPFSRQSEIKAVIDGDTIELSNGERVRYIGIDTPERNQAFYKEATAGNQELLKKGKLKLEYDKDKKDNWGRTLAYVWTDSVMVNAELIKQGLASVYMISPNFKHKEEMVAYQKQARMKKLGIWAIPVSPEKYYVASKHSHGLVFHRPGCQWAQKISDSNLMRFETRDQALDLGYSPCRTCKP